MKPVDQAHDPLFADGFVAGFPHKRIVSASAGDEHQRQLFPRRRADGRMIAHGFLQRVRIGGKVERRIIQTQRERPPRLARSIFGRLMIQPVLNAGRARRLQPIRKDTVNERLCLTDGILSRSRRAAEQKKERRHKRERAAGVLQQSIAHINSPLTYAAAFSSAASATTQQGGTSVAVSDTALITSPAFTVTVA